MELQTKDLMVEEATQQAIKVVAVVVEQERQEVKEGLVHRGRVVTDFLRLLQEGP
jgi:hypothetical protein